MDWITKNWHYLGVIVISLLLYSYYNLTASTVDYIKESTNGQTNIKNSFESGQKIRQAYSLLLTAITLKDDQLLEKSIHLLREINNAPKIVNNYPVSDIEKIYKEMQSLQALHFDQITKRQLATLANLVEELHLKMIIVDQGIWKRVDEANLNLLKTHEKSNNVLKYLILILISLLLGMMIVASMKEKLQRRFEKTSLVQNSIFKSLSDGIIHCKKDGEIISLNESARKILKQNQSTDHPKKIRDLFADVFDKYGNTYNKGNNPILKALLGKEIHEQTVGCFINNHFSWLSLNAQPIFKNSDQTLDSVLFSFTDITEHLKTLELVTDQQKSLTETSKLSSLGVMAAGIAHEINNPLSVLKIYAEIIKLNAKSGKLDPQDIIENAKKIDDTIIRIGKIIDGVKMYSRDTSNDPMEPANLNNVIKDTLEFTHYKIIKENIQVRLKESVDAEIKCIPAQISQVLVNLLKNSIDAIKDLTDKWIEIEIEKNGGKVMVKLTDSGSGIPTNVQSKIFTPFFTTKKAGLGTGLGLAISKGIIEKHSGKLYIDNQCPNTRFVIELSA